MTKPKIIRHVAEGLDVYCWCQWRIVRVPAATVRACRTESCGAANCKPPPSVRLGTG